MKASYERGVLNIEAKLIEEVAMVCRDYCTESWGVAMDRAGVPANSELKRVENIFFPEDFDRFLTRTLLSRSSFPPRLFSLTLTLLGGKEWTGKLSNSRRTNHPRTPSRSEMSSHRLRKLNRSPELKALAPRLLTPRKTRLRIKPRFLDVGFSFVI